MLSDFKKFIEKELELTKGDKILLAVSGGADSVLMLYLFWKAGYNCGIAHCNFHLRDKDSDFDEELVSKLALKYNYPFFKIDFNTTQYAEEKGISIEMAARELRYTWFEKIRKENDYKFIATAHHQDDLIETFFINLTRGTGIRGLSGFDQKKNAIIRPILFANRSSIHQFIKKHNLEFREDRTNSETKFIRNKFRHNILPLFTEINPSYKQNILQTIKNLQDAELLMNNELNHAFKKVVSSKDEITYVNISKLTEYKDIHPYLFEILQPYGFNNDQVINIEKVLYDESGKVFISKSHKLVKDRNTLVIAPIDENFSLPIIITKKTDLVNLPFYKQLILKYLKNNSEFVISKEPEYATLDADKLKFPLEIRKWEQGDYFFPIGMKQKKKLSDFLIDEKINLIDKQNTLLLLSDNQVVWIIGKRIDNRFKITDQSTNILQIRIFNALNV
jgi:tRNA(Ile)-lysidine synthase